MPSKEIVRGLAGSPSSFHSGLTDNEVMPAITRTPKEKRVNVIADNRRSAERFRLGTALVHVVVGAHGVTPETKGFFEGHAYDISDHGVRIEVDAALPVGTPVEVALHMPGLGSPLKLVGKVARLFDEIDDPGPRRMGVDFRAASKADAARLERLLDQAAHGRLI